MREPDSLQEQALQEMQDAWKYYILRVTRNGQQMWSGPYISHANAVSVMEMMFHDVAFIVKGRRLPHDGSREHPQIPRFGADSTE